MDYEKMYVDGQWVSGNSRKWIEVLNPFTMQVFARVPRGDAADVDRAAQAASRAFPAWAAMPLQERIALM